MKAAGHNFIWYHSIYSNTTGDAWLPSTQKAYADFKSMGFLTADDVIVLVDYGTTIPALPEQVNGAPAPTLTGIAYWLLQQN